MMKDYRKSISHYTVIRVLSILTVFFTTPSCSELQVDNISNDNVILNNPTDKATIIAGDVIFWWEQMNYVDDYELSVATAEGNLIILEKIKNTSFTSTLDTGNYVWSVRGINYAYETSRTERSFKVISEPIIDINQKDVILNAPGIGNTFTAGATVVFSWDPVEGATYYDINIGSPSLSNRNNYNAYRRLTVTSLELILDTPGAYEWSVVAGNTKYKTTPNPRALVINEASTE